MTRQDSSVQLRVRPATQDDAHLLLKWRNDPEVRRRSRNGDVIHLDAHRAWLNRVLEDDGRHLLIVESADGLPVATARYDRLEGSTAAGVRWEISISVDPLMRGRGVGCTALRMSDEWLRLAEPDTWEIVAFVQPDNPGSRRLFLRAGYHETSSVESDMDQFVWTSSRAS